MTRVEGGSWPKVCGGCLGKGDLEGKRIRAEDSDRLGTDLQVGAGQGREADRHLLEELGMGSTET